MLHFDFLTSECYSIIVRISCLLAFFDFELTPLFAIRFQNYKTLFYIGTESDLPIVYQVLSDIEIRLLNDLQDFYNSGTARVQI